MLNINISAVIAVDNLRNLRFFLCPSVFEQRSGWFFRVFFPTCHNETKCALLNYPQHSVISTPEGCMDDGCSAPGWRSLFKFKFTFIPVVGCDWTFNLILCVFGLSKKSHKHTQNISHRCGSKQWISCCETRALTPCGLRNLQKTFPKIFHVILGPSNDKQIWNWLKGSYD